MKLLIIGKMASGKSTLANYLQKKHNFKILSLAEPIKWMEEALFKGKTPYTIVKEFMPHLTSSEKFEMTGVLEDTQLLPRESPKPRKRLQFLGTEGGRQRIREDIWIEYADKRAEIYPNVVIDDVRFPNEFEYFSARGWKSIGLEIDSKIQEIRLLEMYGKYDPIVLTHPSEIGVDQIINIPRTHPIDLKINTAITTLEQRDAIIERALIEWS